MTLKLDDFLSVKEASAYLQENGCKCGASEFIIRSRHINPDSGVYRIQAIRLGEWDNHTASDGLSSRVVVLTRRQLDLFMRQCDDPSFKRTWENTIQPTSSESRAIVDTPTAADILSDIVGDGSRRLDKVRRLLDGKSKKIGPSLIYLRRDVEAVKAAGGKKPRRSKLTTKQIEWAIRQREKGVLYSEIIAELRDQGLDVHQRTITRAIKAYFTHRNRS